MSLRNSNFRMIFHLLRKNICGLVLSRCSSEASQMLESTKKIIVAVPATMLTYIWKCDSRNRRQGNQPSSKQFCNWSRYFSRCQSQTWRTCVFEISSLADPSLYERHCSWVVFGSSLACWHHVDNYKKVEHRLRGVLRLGLGFATILYSVILLFHLRRARWTRTAAVYRDLPPVSCHGAIGFSQTWFFWPCRDCLCWDSGQWFGISCVFLLLCFFLEKESIVLKRGYLEEPDLWSNTVKQLERQNFSSSANIAENLRYEVKIRTDVADVDSFPCKFFSKGFQRKSLILTFRNIPRRRRRPGVGPPLFNLRSQLTGKVNDCKI